MIDHEQMKSSIERIIPLLGWITLIGIALFAGLLVLGVMTFATWLAILFFIKILPFIILIAVIGVIWKLFQDRKSRESGEEPQGPLPDDDE